MQSQVPLGLSCQALHAMQHAIAAPWDLHRHGSLNRHELGWTAADVYSLRRLVASREHLFSKGMASTIGLSCPIFEFSNSLWESNFGVRNSNVGFQNILLCVCWQGHVLMPSPAWQKLCSQQSWRTRSWEDDLEMEGIEDTCLRLVAFRCENVSSRISHV